MMVALKEWGAVVHALLDGRQKILLRKGGIHEKAFVVPSGAAGVDGGPGGDVLLYPTVAHIHTERTRPEHHDLLELAAPDTTEDAVTIRAAVRITDVVEVSDPSRLEELADLHIWTHTSIIRDRVEFRPKHPLQILVVQTLPLVAPLTLAREAAHGGCTSWLDLDLDVAVGAPMDDEAALSALSERVRATVQPQPAHTYVDL